MYFSVYL